MSTEQLNSNEEIKPSTAPLIDCHAHLIDAVFTDSLGSILERAHSNDIHGIITVSQTYEEAEKILTLSKQYSLIKPSAGLHPCYIQSLTIESERQSAMENITKFIHNNHEQLICIGECGVDYSPWLLRDEKQDRATQLDIFIKHIELSKQYNLPLNIHSRNGGKYAIETCIQHGVPSGMALFHAFDGSAKVARRAIEAGYFFSIPCSIVRDTQLSKIIPIVPITQLVLESDSPALHAEKGSDRINEPSNILHTINYVASLKQMDSSKLRNQLYENTCRLFRKLRV